MRDYSDLTARLRRTFEADELVNQRILLDAADAIEELISESTDLVGQVKRSQEEIRKLDKELVALRNQLPKRGEWHFHDHYSFECSACGWINLHNDGIPNMFNYCPSCGTRMTDPPKEAE